MTIFLDKASEKSIGQIKPNVAILGHKMLANGLQIKKGATQNLRNSLIISVGVTRFELATTRPPDLKINHIVSCCCFLLFSN